ncbi:MAG: 2-dehydro-3-deoxyphosphogluconate aldolase [Oscillospiraceae bacterium]|nr:2-dehydro-3-deoxyphosphogluconate aldolase [Oscillospiraceae bacterium]MCI9549608.1 2-dehydro-3-deoxyphosphogluconate aldolase [Oscillospiraceae bacterium]
MREQTICTILAEKVIAIVRGVDGRRCLDVAQALYDGGIRLMEVTYDQTDPSSFQATADAIAAVAESFQGRMEVGAGTVTTLELVELSARAGGRFIISPNTDPAVIQRSRELGLVSIPGAMTPTEILAAHQAGADLVKVFPVDRLGPSYLSAVLAPLRHVRLLAVGGVDAGNIPDFLRAGALGVGVGGSLVNAGLVRDGELGEITRRARAMTSAARGA